MSMDKNFRSALNGFNRADVVNYIEENSIYHEKTLRQLKDENEKLRTAMDKLRAEKEELAECIQTAAPPDPAPVEEEPPVIMPPPSPAATEAELAAYRRAEAMERSAKLRVRKLCRHVNEIIENASTHMSDSSSEIDVLMQDLSINLRRLTDTFAELKMTFDDTASAFEAMESFDITD